MILKELSKSDSVPHDGILDLLKESIDVLGTSEVGVDIDISGVGSRVWLIDDILKAGSISDEWQVFNISELVSICSHA